MEEEYEEIDESVKVRVRDLAKEVKADKKYHKDAFDEMRANQSLAREGATKEWLQGDKYVANIIQRHIQQRKSALYAKNPRAIAKRRPRLDFQVWDEDPQSLMQAMQVVQAATDPEMQQLPEVMQAQALVEDYNQGMAQRRKIDKIGKSMELCYHYYLDEQVPRFKTSAKKLVGRTLINGVSYLKMGFDRAMEHSADRQNQMADISSRIAHIERLVEEFGKAEWDEHSAEHEELTQALTRLQEEKDVLVKEGLAYDFPRSTSIIPDRNCQSLHGWLGAERVTQEFIFTPDEIKEIYGCDVGKHYLRYKEDGTRAMVRSNKDKEFACVWEIYLRSTGEVVTICDGYHDYLDDPRSPVVQVEQFFPFWALVFNDIESEDSIFPHSDVYYLQHQQMEHNRAGQGLREHRRAARPRYVAPQSAFDDKDAGAIECIGPHEVGFVNLPPGISLTDIIQRVPTAPIDPNLYTTAPIFDEVLKIVGSQEANLGGMSGATATESSIAEASRMSSQSSNVDDLDDFLTDVARASGQVMLKELSQETVKKIAGPGAVWPEYTAQEIADELYLEVKAGSSGRPNKAQEMANFERVAPFLLQTPGVSPAWLAKYQVELLDDSMDYAEAITSGLPSIIAQNQMQRPGTGDASTNPEQQGAEGGNNAGNPDQGNEGPQPAMPPGV